MSQSEVKIEMESFISQKAENDPSDGPPNSHESPQSPDGEGKTGVAFSGGGIRSAALCSGVLRRLLQKEARIDYLSCVSGGGYTGTAYLDWKYRHGKTDDKGWHQEFFNNMSERAGLICNWRKPLEAICDTILLVLLLLLVNVVAPLIIWGSYACPVAFIVDFLFGKLLRAKLDCDAVAATQSPDPSSSDPNATAQEVRQRCLIRQGTDSFATLMLFTVLGVLFITFFILAKKVRNRKVSNRLSASHTAIAFIVGFTFIPFAIHDFLNAIPRWTQVLVIAIGVIVWAFLPLLRRKTSYVLVIYIYGYVVYWKVYEASVFGLVYSDELFNHLLFASGFLVWFVPIVDVVHKNVIHVFNRWKLQKAFYSKNSIGRKGCAGITIQDICPLCTCLSGDTGVRDEESSLSLEDPGDNGVRDEEGSLSLADLGKMKPEYLSNVVVNNWRVPPTKETYELLTMSPTKIERLDKEGKFADKLEPRDIKLSDAMATSAAAISSHMGSYEESVEGLTRFHGILGLEMGTSMISDLASIKREPWYEKMLPFVVQIILGLPLVCVPALYYDHSVTITDSSIAAGVFIFFVIHVVLGVFAIQDVDPFNEDQEPNGIDQTPSRFQTVARWFIVHVPFVHFIREIMAVVNEGPMPPPILLLSDGGHIENLGILPLLDKKLKNIIVVDGGYTDDETLYGHSLLKALQLARTKLRCSFIGLDGCDVITDLLEKFVDPKKHARHYRFKVRYQDGTNGEVLLIKPRCPLNGANEENETITTEFRTACGDPVKWGSDCGPYLREKHDVDSLTFCCCECCHVDNKWLRKVSKECCGVFPFHSTVNQFFTRRMFIAYHREGYRACAEAEC